MCLDVCIDVCIDLCIDMCLDVCIDVCIDMCMDVCMDMCIDVYLLLALQHPCTEWVKIRQPLGTDRNTQRKNEWQNGSSSYRRHNAPPSIGLTVYRPHRLAQQRNQYQSTNLSHISQS